MTSISCQQFTEWSSDLLDGELGAAETGPARAHLGSCARCQALWRSLETSVRLLGDERMFAAPAGLHERLQAAVAEGLDEPLAPAELRPAGPRTLAAAPRGRWSWGRWMGAGPRSWRLAAGVVVVVIVVATAGLLRVRAGAITTSGWLIDTHCLSSYQTKLAEHPSACLLKCAKQTPVGVVDAKGHFLRFDARGRSRVMAEVAASHQPDHLWVTVRGKRSGTAAAPVLDVEQVELTPPGTTAFEAK